MEFIQFLRVLYRRKLLLVIIPLVAVVVTYFLLRNVPDRYVSKARLATGLTDVSNSLINESKSESQISQQFSNLVQQLSSKRMIDMLSYQCLLHDLTSPQPFRAGNEALAALSDADKKAMIALLQKKHAAMEELSLADKQENKLHQLLIDTRFDEDVLTKLASIYRINNSDYISVEFSTYNAELSAFAANTLCSEFINYYTSIFRKNQMQVVSYLAGVLEEKRANMDSLTNELKNYKVQNQVLNLNEEAKALFGQIADFETRRSLAIKDIQAYTAVMHNIDSKFSPTERRYLENSLANINKDIIQTRQLLYTANDTYITSGFNENYKPRIDSLRNVLAEQINQSSDKYLVDPLITKKELISQKLVMETQVELAQNSLTALQDELNRLNTKIRSLVPHEAQIQNFEYRFDVASREYIELLAKYNQASIVGNYSVGLKQVEIAQPNPATGSKKLLYVILAGLVSFILCVVVIFIGYYFDNGVYRPSQLANQTKAPVLGFLNDLKDVSFNPASIWKDDNVSEELQIFKSLMRSARFEIDKAMDGGGLLLITSVFKNDGKSLFALNLAYAFAKANKSVVFMDADPDNKYVEKSKHASTTIENYFSGVGTYEFVAGEPLVVRTKSTTYRTLYEIAPSAAVKAKTDELKKRYDYIMVNVPSLQALNMPQEWLNNADKIVAVFKAGESIDELARTKISFLKNLDNKFIGWVMNRIPDNELTYIKAT